MLGFLSPALTGSAVPWTALADPRLSPQVSTLSMNNPPQSLRAGGLAMTPGLCALFSSPEKEWKDSGQFYIEFLLPKHFLLVSVLS